MNPQSYFHLPGEIGIFQTIYQMKGLVNNSFTHPQIRETAAAVTESCGRDPKCHHQALQNYVTSHVQYLRDPQGVEALHDPVTFYEKRLRSGLSTFGDCDDMSIYLATLLKSIGHKPEFRVVGRGDRLHHILVTCENEHLDSTMGLGRYPLTPGRAIRVPI